MVKLNASIYLHSGLNLALLFIYTVLEIVKKKFMKREKAMFSPVEDNSCKVISQSMVEELV